LPTAGFKGRMFISTDTFAFYRDTGTGWDLIGGPGTGTLTGSGVSGQVSFFNGTQTITGNNNLFWDNVNSRLGINTATPGQPLDIHSTGNTLVQLNNTSTGNSNISFQNQDVAKWRVGNVYNAGANSFDIQNAGLLTNAISINSTTNNVNFGSTIGNGTYTYTLPSATGTIALTSNLSSYLPLAGGIMTGSILLNNNLAISGQLFATSSYASMISMSPSNKVVIDSNSQGVLFGGTIGQGAYTYTLPSATGTLALTSQISGYLPLTGGTLTGGLYINPTNTGIVGLDVASNTTIIRSDNLEGFKRQLEITMGSGTLVQLTAKGFGATYVTDLAFYTSASGTGVNSSPAIYLTGGNRVGIKTGTPSYDLDVTGTFRATSTAIFGSTIGNGTYTYTLPGATGTLALTSDIPSLANYVTLNGTQTITGAKTFQTSTIFSSTIGNGTYTYTLPSATGTLALTSQISGYLPLTGGTLTGGLNLTYNSPQIILNASTGGTNGLYFNENSVAVGNITSNANFFQLTNFSSGGWLFKNSVGTNVLTISDNGGFTLTGANAVVISSQTGSSSNLIFDRGSSGNSAYISWFNPSGDRLGYMGYSTTNLGITLNNSANLTINGGNLLIGTTTDNGSKMRINGTSNGGSVIYAESSGIYGAFFSLYANSAGGKAFRITSTGASAGEGAGKLLILNETDGTPGLTLLSTGQLGIGTNNPSYQLQLSTDSAAKPTTSLWTIASDIRIKENINPYNKGLNYLLKINPITYDYNGLGGFIKGKGGVGIIAQEIINILPDSVNIMKVKLNETDVDETDILNFNGHELIYVIVNSIKEQQIIIEELNKKLIKNNIN
jgi:hypothetical protein